MQTHEGYSYPRPDPRPTIQVNGRHISGILDEAWAAVLAVNDPPFLFRDGERLVRRVATMSGFYLLPVRRSALLGILDRVADWVRVTPSGPVLTKPPSLLITGMRLEPDRRLPEGSARNSLAALLG